MRRFQRKLNKSVFVRLFCYYKAVYESLKQHVERDKKKKLLEKQIATLENKIRKEKQLNRRLEMNAELKKLRRKLEVL